MSAVPPPPLPMNLPPPPGAPPPTMTTLSAGSGSVHQTVLLTKLPDFLLSRQAVHDCAAVCGPTINVLLFPLESNEQSKGFLPSILNEDLPRAALVTLASLSAAQTLAASVRQLTGFAIEAHLVPSNPDAPLHSLPEAQQNVTTALQNALAKKKQEVNEASVLPVSTVVLPPQKENKTPGIQEEDAEEEEDPLSSPAVLAAVREFRLGLTSQSETQTKKRRELVESRLRELRPKIRQRMEQEASNPGGPLPPPLPSNLPPPPPAKLPPPPPSNLPLPPPPLPTNPPMPGNVAPAAPRGVSNLPAWMTKKQTDPNAWKIQAFAAVSQRSALEKFVKDRIQQYIGEAEESFVAFCMGKVVASTETPETIAPEIQDFLEDDTWPFLQAVWEKSRELSQ